MFAGLQIYSICAASCSLIAVAHNWCPCFLAVWLSSFRSRASFDSRSHHEHLQLTSKRNIRVRLQSCYDSILIQIIKALSFSTMNRMLIDRINHPWKRNSFRRGKRNQATRFFIARARLACKIPCEQTPMLCNTPLRAALWCQLLLAALYEPLRLCLLYTLGESVGGEFPIRDCHCGVILSLWWWQELVASGASLINGTLLYATLVILR
jgi:hypothetical protein